MIPEFHSRNYDSFFLNYLILNNNNTLISIFSHCTSNTTNLYANQYFALKFHLHCTHHQNVQFSYISTFTRFFLLHSDTYIAQTFKGYEERGSVSHPFSFLTFLMEMMEMSLFLVFTPDPIHYPL